jgi:hypothetical protein
MKELNGRLSSSIPREEEAQKGRTSVLADPDLGGVELIGIGGLEVHGSVLSISRFLTGGTSMSLR